MRENRCRRWITADNGTIPTVPRLLNPTRPMVIGTASAIDFDRDTVDPAVHGTYRKPRRGNSREHCGLGSSSLLARQAIM